MNDDPRLNAALFDGATRALTLSIDHMMMIGRSSAEERLAWFLTMLSGRSAWPRARVLDLAMQRQDIADYLGLTIETVSRTFTLFRDRGFLKPAAQAPGRDPEAGGACAARRGGRDAASVFEPDDAAYRGGARLRRAASIRSVDSSALAGDSTPD